MGVDTKAILLQPVDAGRIADILREDYGATDVKVMPTSETYYFRITYQHPEEPRGRMMSVFSDGVANRDYCSDIEADLRDATLLSLGASGDAEGAMRSVLARFGGYLLVNDCGPDPWQGVPASGHVGPDPSDAPRFDAALSRAVDQTLATFRAAGFTLPEHGAEVLRPVIEAAMRELAPAPAPAAEPSADPRPR